MQLSIARLDTPLGEMQIVSDVEGLCAIDFSDCEDRLMTHLNRRFGAADLKAEADPFGAVTALTRFFDGDVTLSTLSPQTLGAPPFNKRFGTLSGKFP